MLVQMGIFPNFRGENTKYLSCHHLVLLVCFLFCFCWFLLFFAPKKTPKDFAWSLWWSCAMPGTKLRLHDWLMFFSQRFLLLKRPFDTPWKINMEHVLMDVWKIIFLSKWVICMFHVNLPGCTWLKKKNRTAQGMDKPCIKKKMASWQVKHSKRVGVDEWRLCLWEGDLTYMTYQII